MLSRSTSLFFTGDSESLPKRHHSLLEGCAHNVNKLPLSSALHPTAAGKMGQHSPGDFQSEVEVTPHFGRSDLIVSVKLVTNRQVVNVHRPIQNVDALTVCCPPTV